MAKYKWSPRVNYRYIPSIGGRGLNTSEADYIKMLRDKLLDPNAEAGRAAIDVGAQYDKALDIQSRQMGRMGINPASPRYQGLMQDVNLARAASTAGEMGRAWRAAENENYDRLRGLASLMQNEKQLQMQNAQLALAQQRYQDELNAGKAAYNEYRRNLKDDFGSLFGSPVAQQPQPQQTANAIAQPQKYTAPLWRDVYLGSPTPRSALEMGLKNAKRINHIDAAKTGLYSNYA